MASTFIQFRTDEKIKAEATLICKELGMDLPTYMRMCLYRLVSTNGIPFDMVIRDESKSSGIDALLKMSSISKENGNSEMSLNEINEEILEARK